MVPVSKHSRASGLEESVGPRDHTALPGETLCSTERGGERNSGSVLRSIGRKMQALGTDGFPVSEL